MQYADADPSVVDEARELAERHTYLLKHVEDLRSAAQTLRTMMEVADVEMRTQFDVAFAAVNEEFSRVFEVMLRGGRARLEQLEGGGVEVIAQLPGKRSRSSAAFSGGERSLIASSLLFGVLKMRPAPFCVLDEVDAALDEGNVDRYLTALRDISQKTQAVVVTHNRATMAAADVLYGLTMDAEGASNVLSLRLESQVAG
jgi:chromosome segregation protein